MLAKFQRLQRGVHTEKILWFLVTLYNWTLCSTFHTKIGRSLSITTIFLFVIVRPKLHSFPSLATSQLQGKSLHALALSSALLFLATNLDSTFKRYIVNVTSSFENLQYAASDAELTQKARVTATLISSYHDAHHVGKYIDQYDNNVHKLFDDFDGYGSSYEGNCLIRSYRRLDVIDRIVVPLCANSNAVSNAMPNGMVANW